MRRKDDDDDDNPYGNGPKAAAGYGDGAAPSHEILFPPPSYQLQKPKPNSDSCASPKPHSSLSDHRVPVQQYPPPTH